MDDAKAINGIGSVNLKDFYCNYIELTVRFSIGDFDKESFLKDVGGEQPKDRYSFIYGSQAFPAKQHAHIDIRFLSEEKGRARILYTRSDEHVTDERPPYMEDCGQWLGGFFKTENLHVSVEVGFEFDGGFKPTIPLPFPLVTESEALAGVKVNGLGLKFPDDSYIHTAIIQRFGEVITLTVLTAAEVSARGFNGVDVLKHVYGAVGTLVRKAGETE
jgi:hypothetical protein